MPHTGERSDRRRPRGVAAAAALLVLTAAVTGLAGIALSAVSGCCGSPEPADDSYAGYGVLLASGLLVAAAGLWSGRVPGPVALALTLPLPVACTVMAASSMDMVVVAPFAIVAWLSLALLVRAEPAAGWLRSGRSPGAG